MKLRAWKSSQSDQSLMWLRKSVSAGVLVRWVKLEPERREASDGKSEADLRAKNARLHRELAEVKADKDISPKRQQKSSN